MIHDLCYDHVQLRVLSGHSGRIAVSEPVLLTNSDASGDKSKGLSTTGGDGEDFGFSICAAPLQYLHPRISEDKGTERRRSDEGWGCQKAEGIEEHRGEFAGSIQDDIRTEGQSPQHAEYLYFTLDMYSNQEVERDIAEA